MCKIQWFVIIFEMTERLIILLVNYVVLVFGTVLQIVGYSTTAVFVQGAAKLLYIATKLFVFELWPLLMFYHLFSIFLKNIKCNFNQGHNRPFAWK
jgi:hypothetical protein